MTGICVGNSVWREFANMLYRKWTSREGVGQSALREWVATVRMLVEEKIEEKRI